MSTATLTDDVQSNEIVEILVSARDQGLIGPGGMTVCGSARPPGLPIRFTYGEIEERLPSGEILDPRPVLQLTLNVRHRRSGSATPFLPAEWGEDDDVESMTAVLKDKLRRAERPREARALDLSASLDQLRFSLQLAEHSVDSPTDTPRIHGVLFETIAKRWVITSAGLEEPERGYLLPAESFPSHRWTSTDGVSFLQAWKPRRPQWCPVEQWGYVTERAQVHLPRGL
jgi:hypothetical protein